MVAWDRWNRAVVRVVEECRVAEARARDAANVMPVKRRAFLVEARRLRAIGDAVRWGRPVYVRHR